MTKEIKFYSYPEEVQEEINEIIFRDHNQIMKIGDKIINHSFSPFCRTILNIYKKDSEIFLKLKNEDGEIESDESVKMIFNNRAYVVTPERYEELFPEMRNCLNNEDDFGKTSQSTELVASDKNQLEFSKREMILKSNELGVKQAILKRLLDDKLSIFNEYVDKMKKDIKKINKVIYTIELYMGIKEQILHLKQGVKAPKETPISIRQKILYMDIEVADPVGGGLDFENLEDFDKWLFKKCEYYDVENYKTILPEEKCIVALKIRQSEKDYHDRFLNSVLNPNNMSTYILMRNGENVYRIWTDKNIYPRMFPSESESLKMMEYIDQDDFIHARDSKKQIFNYKLQCLILQGIIERGKIFEVDGKIDFFKPDILEDSRIQFVRDDEPEKLLSNPKKTLKEFLEGINADAKEGSRVYCLFGNIRKGCIEHYFYKEYRCYESSYPNCPKNGMYILYKDKQKDCFYIKADTRDPYWADMTKRVHRYSFLIDFKDHYVTSLNYDSIKEKDLETLRFMLWDRRNRYDNDYLKNIPLLKNVYDLRRKELDYEKYFISLVKTQIDTTDDVVKAGLDWWKLKNKWKRDLKVDEPKALRMIVNKIKRNISRP